MHWSSIQKKKTRKNEEEEDDGDEEEEERDNADPNDKLKASAFVLAPGSRHVVIGFEVSDTLLFIL